MSYKATHISKKDGSDAMRIGGSEVVIYLRNENGDEWVSSASMWDPIIPAVPLRDALYFDIVRILLDDTQIGRGAVSIPATKIRRLIQERTGQVEGETAAVVHDMTVRYTNSDDGIHLTCLCDADIELGFFPSVEAVVLAERQHMLDVGKS